MKFGKGISKWLPWMDKWGRVHEYMTQLEGFVNPKNAVEISKLRSLFMNWSKHLGVGIFILL
jgi:hypothetical protein